MFSLDFALCKSGSGVWLPLGHIAEFIFEHISLHEIMKGGNKKNLEDSAVFMSLLALLFILIQGQAWELKTGMYL